VHVAGTKPPTQWRAFFWKAYLPIKQPLTAHDSDPIHPKQWRAWWRPLGPAPAVRSAGDFRICGRYTIPGASRSRPAQEHARRPIASQSRRVLHPGRVYCPVPVHRRRVPHRAPSRLVHDSGPSRSRAAQECAHRPSRPTLGVFGILGAFTAPFPRIGGVCPSAHRA
jgi:hypothetical protein